ncbi:MAG: hypothetical protein ACR2KC_04985 [Acidimicrobiales bacterium]
MTTARSELRSRHGRSPTGERRQRRLERRRMLRQEMLALGVLALALVVTLTLLAMQWLSASTTLSIAPLVHLSSEAAHLV